ncbi:alpha-2,3 sialyltransferase [Campylobacter lari]|nr:alpha-2,3 sialyltransferase [Campylobacter lari]HEG5919192.1 alpha-2,3 sialyltransferase [Campylobacter lari]
MLMNGNSRSAIIAGNGPSLSKIDYKRMPKDFDVFRTNQFYFEKKYYLGNKIKYAFANPGLFLEQYYTLNVLKNKNEYNIDNIFCATFNLDHMVNKIFIDKFSDYFPGVMLAYDLIRNLHKFHEFIKFNEIYNDRRITSGIYMCAIAIALNYKELYLTGIDFYDEALQEYAFESKKQNIINLAPAFNTKNSKYNKHSRDMDLEALDFLQKNYDVKIYSLNPDSILSQHIDIAPNIDNIFILSEKPKGFIDDILIPNFSAYHYTEIAKIRQDKNGRIFSNFYYKLIRDFVKLPSDIKHYLKEKHANKNR